ncbi:glycosyltransferase family 8 protein [Conservatibacter flavescens]|uniref:Glycosyl transferase family 8 n=1 Tax=Conservatibacter flavescens TaxID=28161 RepID=A0A2M8S3F3_9PAST|nr:glycosyltransferase family 8 protein [Conservatibacter flavescens]PJG85670.1 hypothetical protein CVP05_04765 [Conservatibacter flavescens]
MKEISIENLLLAKTDIITHIKSSNKIYHIAFGADNNYLTYLRVLLFSILKNNSNINIHFHIFTEDMPYDEIIFLQQLKYSNFNTTFYKINTEYFSHFKINKNIAHINQATYYRAVMPLVLQEQFLYLDIDTLCTGSLEPLLEIQLNTNLLAASPDLANLNYIQSLYPFGFPKWAIYFNAGVLLINVKKWNKNQLTEKFIQLINQQNFTYMDQDILNILANGDVYFISNKFNWTDWLGDKQNKFLFMTNNVSIIHYTGEIKPWHQAGESKIYSQYYKELFGQVPHLLEPKTTNAYRKSSKLLWKKKPIKACYYQLKYIYNKLLNNSA